MKIFPSPVQHSPVWVSPIHERVTLPDRKVICTGMAPATGSVHAYSRRPAVLSWTMRIPGRRYAQCLTAVALLAAVAPRAVAGQPPPRSVRADAEFLQGMIGHHAQAITMSGLLPSRTKNGPLNSLAERIIVSQRDEIKLMRRWLLEHGADAPDPVAHPEHHGHGALMPGMLTPEQMAQLAAATGPEFERLFLEGMIRHHEGAITMTTALFATKGAAQDLMVYKLASDIEADQRAEIARMRALLTP